MQWLASLLTEYWLTSAYLRPRPTAGRDEISSTYSEDRIALRGDFKCRSTEVRGPDSPRTCPAEPTTGLDVIEETETPGHCTGKDTTENEFRRNLMKSWHLRRRPARSPVSVQLCEAIPEDFAHYR